MILLSEAFSSVRNRYSTRLSVVCNVCNNSHKFEGELPVYCIFIMPQCACASEIYGSVFVCVSVSVCVGCFLGF